MLLVEYNYILGKTVDWNELKKFIVETCKHNIIKLFTFTLPFFSTFLFKMLHFSLIILIILPRHSIIKLFLYSVHKYLQSIYILIFRIEIVS